MKTKVGFLEIRRNNLLLGRSLSITALAQEDDYISPRASQVLPHLLNPQIGIENPQINVTRSPGIPHAGSQVFQFFTDRSVYKITF